MDRIWATSPSLLKRGLGTRTNVPCSYLPHLVRGRQSSSDEPPSQSPVGEHSIEVNNRW